MEMGTVQLNSSDLHLRVLQLIESLGCSFGSTTDRRCVLSHDRARGKKIIQKNDPRIESISIGSRSSQKRVRSLGGGQTRGEFSIPHNSLSNLDQSEWFHFHSVVKFPFILKIKKAINKNKKNSWGRIIRWKRWWAWKEVKGWALGIIVLEMLKWMLVWKRALWDFDVDPSEACFSRLEEARAIGKASQVNAFRLSCNEGEKEPSEFYSSTELTCTFGRSSERKEREKGGRLSGLALDFCCFANSHLYSSGKSSYSWPPLVHPSWHG